MLKTKLIHPEIISALAYCGHCDKVLITDANYPLEQKTGEAEKVYLGYKPGEPNAVDVLETILTAVNVEKIEIMLTDEGEKAPIVSEFEKTCGLEAQGLPRGDFYKACEEPIVRLAIQTGEKRLFANVLLTIGVA